jgi:V8-like Glu-specific endopeptidase
MIAVRSVGRLECSFHGLGFRRREMNATRTLALGIAVAVTGVLPLVPRALAETATEAPASLLSSQYPGDPEQYVPMPIPVQSALTPRLPGPCYVVTYDCRTGQQTVGPELVLGSLEESVSTASAELGVWPDASRMDIKPLAFSALTGVTQTTEFPWRTVCKVYVDFRAKTGETIKVYASGVLIDPNHVLTAGHCVYQHVITINGVNYTIEGMPIKVVVVPAYQEEVRPFGYAGTLGYRALSRWTVDEDFEYDVAVIRLDRPLGALTSYMLYGAQSDSSFFTTTVFHNASYPSEPPYVGETMYDWYGLFDGTSYNPSTQKWEGNSLILNEYSYGGQSGSGAFATNPSGAPTVYAVLSHGNGDRTHFVRIEPTVRDDIADFIKGNAAPAGDLTPLAVKVSPAEVSLGGTVSSISFVLYNAAVVPWSGRLDFDVFLSRNRVIGGEDAPLGSGYYVANVSFAPKEAQVVIVPPVALPAAKGSGDYWIGVKLRTFDWDQTNNVTGPQDVAPIVMGIHKLANDVPETYAYTGESGFYFDVTDSDWCCVGINPTKDYNLYVSEGPAGLYAHSKSTGTARDFVVVNGHTLEGDTTFSAGVRDAVGGIFTVEATWNIPDLTVGTVVSDSIDATEVHQMYEVKLASGKTYDLNLEIKSGGVDLSIFVFKPTRRTGSRLDCDWVADKVGAYGGARLSLRADSSGFYGIAVINENAKSGEYTIGVKLAE